MADQAAHEETAGPVDSAGRPNTAALQNSAETESRQNTDTTNTDTTNTDISASSEAAGTPAVVSIELLISEHHADAYRYAYRLSGSHTDAEDLVQQTYLVAHQKLHQLREVGRARAWMFSVLRSCFLKSVRRSTPATATKLNLDLEDVSDDFDPQLLEVDAEQLQQALNQLPDESRIVLTMFYFEEASYKEISEELQIKMGTVMSRLSRAKQRLRRTLFDVAEHRGAPQQTVGSSSPVR